ncbi:putative reverse transcriptase domain-containing protein [Tanacetum coccineum]
MMSHKQSTNARRIYAPQHKVLTNDDLLTQILIRLPILCIRLFTTVSKQWLRILASSDFTRNRSQIRNIDPPAGLFVNHITSSFHCVFVSLDIIIKSRKYTSDNSFTLGYTELVDNVNILLCTGWEVSVRIIITPPFLTYNNGSLSGVLFPEADIPLLLPSTSHRTDIPKAEMSPQKRACFATSTPELEIEKSSTPSAARQPEPTPKADTQRTKEFQERSAAIEAYVKTLEAQVATLIAQTTSLQTRLTTALGRIEILEARDPEPQDGPAEAGSSY